jgi:glutamate-1-semialdehyde 2,1-aminomutase
LERRGIPHAVNAAGGIFSFFFTAGPVHDLEGAQRGDRLFFTRYFAAMLDRGIYFAPSPYESNFLSTAHTQADIDQTVAASAEALDQVLEIHLSSRAPGP